MSTSAVKEASLLKPPRHRRTKAQMGEYREALVALADELTPTTIRHFFYVAVARRLIPKTEAAYDNLCSELADLRRNDSIPWETFVDEGRDVVEPYCFDDATERIKHISWIIQAPQNFWQEQPCKVIVITEKNAITSILRPLCRELLVPLVPLGGFNVGFLHEKVAPLLDPDKLNTLVMLFDWDASGQTMREQAERDIRHFRPDCTDIEFEWAAVTPEQIAEYDLPTRPSKRDKNPHARGFKSKVSVELDALDPDTLVEIVRERIERRIITSLLDKSKRRERRDRRETVIRVARGEAGGIRKNTHALVPLNLSPDVRGATRDLRSLLAKAFHPDHGGDPAKMAKANAAIDTIIQGLRSRRR